MGKKRIEKPNTAALYPTYERVERQGVNRKKPNSNANRPREKKTPESGVATDSPSKKIKMWEINRLPHAFLFWFVFSVHIFLSRQGVTLRVYPVTLLIDKCLRTRRLHAGFEQFQED